MDVVINGCHGGFCLSRKGVEWLAAKGHKAALAEKSKNEELLARMRAGEELEWYDASRAKDWAAGDDRAALGGYGWHPDDTDLPRHDPLLVSLVREVGDDAGPAVSALYVVEIPDGVDYEIQDYDGLEWIAEKHRTWS